MSRLLSALLIALVLIAEPAAGFIYNTWGGSGAVLLPAYTVSSGTGNPPLPTCNSGEVGTLVYVSDSVASPVYGLPPLGGGTLSWPVFCTNNNGTYYWTNH